MAKALIDPYLKSTYHHEEVKQIEDLGYRKSTALNLYGIKRGIKSSSQESEEQLLGYIKPFQKWRTYLHGTKEDFEIIISSSDIEEREYWKKLATEQFELELSTNLSHIENEIKLSSYILELEAGWDGENAKPISQEIYDSAIRFLRTYSQYIYSNFGISINSPEINPCPDDSVDLSWRTKNVRMLVNIRQHLGEPHAFFYLDFYENKKPLKGNTPVSEFEEALAVWMKKLS